MFLPRCSPCSLSLVWFFYYLIWFFRGKAGIVVVVVVVVVVEAASFQQSGRCQNVLFIPFTDQRALMKGDGMATAKTTITAVDTIPPTTTANERTTTTTTTTATDVKSKNGPHHGRWPTARGLAQNAFSLLAVAEMARKHFVSMWYGSDLTYS